MPNLPTQRHARLFRNGRNQALRIPREFELPGDVEPVKKPNTLAELLASWELLDEEFPEIEDRPGSHYPQGGRPAHLKPEDIF